MGEMALLIIIIVGWGIILYGLDKLEQRIEKLESKLKDESESQGGSE